MPGQNKEKLLRISVKETSGKYLEIADSNNLVKPKEFFYFDTVGSYTKLCWTHLLYSGCTAQKQHKHEFDNFIFPLKKKS